MSSVGAGALVIFIWAAAPGPQAFGQFASNRSESYSFVAREFDIRSVEAGLDERLLRDVYGLGVPWSSIMRGADATAWPVFLGVAPVLGVVALATWDRDNARFALGIGVAEVSAISVTAVLKRLVDRRRPYRALDDIEARASSHRDGRTSDPYSFPSGHAAMSFAVATAISLENSAWYVVAPACLWAASVAASRMWLGVHYPTDVLAGAVVGVATAILAHWVAGEILPDRPGITDTAAAVRVFSVTL